MANKLEAARDYLVSVAKRTVGIDAYKRVTEYQSDLEDNSKFSKALVVSLTIAQTIMPACVTNLHLWLLDKNRQMRLHPGRALEPLSGWEWVGRSCGSAILDTSTFRYLNFDLNISIWSNKPKHC